MVYLEMMIAKLIIGIRGRPINIHYFRYGKTVC